MEASLQIHYRVCREITKKASSTFFLGSLLMPHTVRTYVWAVYAFCRYSDDTVDNRVDDLSARESLKKLRQIVISCGQRETITNGDSYSGEMRSIYIALHDTFKNNSGLGVEPFLELLNGVESDIGFAGFETMAELEAYCHQVAGGVGEMVCQILGLSDPVMIARARTMGNAMQLTNILRDLGEDLGNGRVYIPKELLKKFGVGLNDVEERARRGEDLSEVSSYRAMMEYLVACNRADYQEARSALYSLPRATMIPLLTASLMYEDILHQIERQKYDVFNRRAYTSSLRKVRLLSRAVVKSFLPMLH